MVNKKNVINKKLNNTNLKGIKHISINLYNNTKTNFHKRITFSKDNTIQNNKNLKKDFNLMNSNKKYSEVYNNIKISFPKKKIIIFLIEV